MLQEDHRVRVADRRAQQALGVRRGGGHDHLQAGDVGEPGLEALRVLGGRAGPGPDGGADAPAARCAAPPSMKWILAAWLTIWSIAHVTKSEN